MKSGFVFVDWGCQCKYNIFFFCWGECVVAGETCLLISTYILQLRATMKRKSIHFPNFRNKCHWKYILNKCINKIASIFRLIHWSFRTDTYTFNTAVLSGITSWNQEGIWPTLYYSGTSMQCSSGAYLKISHVKDSISPTSHFWNHVLHS